VQRVLRLTTRARVILRIPAPVLGEILHEAGRTWPLETGGVLLGKLLPPGPQVVQVLGPGPGARHERRSYEPDQEWQAAQTAAAWAADPTLHYLGDWHTHPGGTTGLSVDDSAALRLVSMSPAARQPQPVMLIVSLAHDGTTRLGGGQLRGSTVRRLEAVVEGAARWP
jgi:integrative and conjugative element protein (TIGR02256 family)